jgi:hypothetical protein
LKSLKIPLAMIIIGTLLWSWRTTSFLLIICLLVVRCSIFSLSIWWILIFFVSFLCLRFS